MRSRPFAQVDVFSPTPLLGNPLAVVLDGEGLTDEEMQAFARWTNLSETTFLLPPTVIAADYRLRIFTPGGELPFAGHPTLGSAHAWLANRDAAETQERLVQECGVGLVELRVGSDSIAFAAPPLRRSGPVDQATASRAVASLGLEASQVVAVEWVDNGPGWLVVLVDDAATVLAIRPDLATMGDLEVGVVGPYRGEGPADYEVRAFVPRLGVPEDPVTGSLNAGIAVWFLASGIVAGDYTVRQGTALGRNGRVSVTTDGETIWIGGVSTTVISGTVLL